MSNKKRIKKQVKKINKKLLKLINKVGQHDKAIVYLEQLKELKVNLRMLTKTKVGHTVNLLRKLSNNIELRILAKALIKDWKKLLPKPNSNDLKNKVSNENKENGWESQLGIQNPDSEQTPQNETEIKPEPVEFCWTGGYDATRLKARNLLTDSLSANGGDQGIKANSEYVYKASQLEEAIFETYHAINDMYRAAVRSRAFNLRDPNNPNLRANYLEGKLTAQRLAKMTSNEMASKEMKQLREQYRYESFIDSQLSTFEGTKTALLKCSKCKSRECTYSQLQTRSGDESITTFAMCSNCGNRWKFN